VPELTTCQELGRSLLLNKSAMADEVGRAGGRGWGEGGPSPPAWAHWGWSPSFPHVLPLTHCCQIQAQLDKLGTRKEEVSDKWDRHWEWLQQSEWGPRHTGLKDTGPSTDTSGQGPEDDMSLFCTPPVDAQKRTQGPGGGGGVNKGATLSLNPRHLGGETGTFRNSPSPCHSWRAQNARDGMGEARGAWEAREDSRCPRKDPQTLPAPHLACLPPSAGGAPVCPGGGGGRCLADSPGAAPAEPGAGQQRG
jgi:hypothetical protein